MSLGTIALDADGVLVDYHAGYRLAWYKAFGEWLPDVHPRHYHAQERFGARTLTAAELTQLRTFGFNDETWYSMPLLPGVDEACKLLVEAGYRLEVVSALPPASGPARLAGLRAQGLELKGIHAVGGDQPPGNPKKAPVAAMQAIALVDDYAPFLEGIAAPTLRVLIEGGWEGSPNGSYQGPPADEVHGSLLAFARSSRLMGGRYTRG